MFTGQKDKDREILNYPRALRARKNGFTLVEILITAFILLIIITALFLVLNIGNFSNTVSGAKLELQQDVRRAMDWIIKDLRQSSRMQLEPQPPFLQPISSLQLFRCTGFDVTKNQIEWSPTPIRYSLDSQLQRIVRTEGDREWQFNNISNLAFESIEFKPNLLRITISGEKTARGTIKPTFTLKEEVKLRNE